MSYWKLSSSKSIVGFSLALDVIILDQITKWLALEYIIRPQHQPNTNPLSLIDWIMAPPPRWPATQVEVTPFFNFSMVWNEGVSFGVLSNMGIWPLSILSLLVTAVFAVWLTRAQGWTLAVGLACVIGGAIGNVIDRFRFGAVADFLDFHAYGWHYPSFNVADCAITVGIALVVFDGLILEPKRKKRLEEATT